MTLFAMYTPHNNIQACTVCLIHFVLQYIQYIVKVGNI